MSNTLTRTISGTGFIIVMIVGLLVNKFLYAALITFMMITMMMEFYKMTMGKKYIFSRILAIMTGEILFLLMFMISTCHLSSRFLAFIILPLLILMINSLYVKDKTEFWKFSHMYAGILYIAVPLAMSNLLVFHEGEFSGLMMLCFFIIIWAGDIGAFVFGVSFGKNGKKLFPSISPNKSWIGFWGGMFSSVLVGAILKYFGIFEYPLIHCLALPVVMEIAGVYGDLFESQWKRCYGLKDSGNMIPGHGGMLDRFDSALFAIPAGVLYLAAFNLL